MVEGYKFDRSSDFKNKDKACQNLEKSLKENYVIIKDILYEELTDENADATGDNLQIDFLCRKNPRDPGMRDQASYARWDFITKCQLADVAQCKKEFFEAAKNKEVLFRKVTPHDAETWGKIEYAREPKQFTGEMKGYGYEVLEDCEFGYWKKNDPDSPFWDMPLPFDPEDLSKTCGDAGYEYYYE